MSNARTVPQSNWRCRSFWRIFWRGFEDLLQGTNPVLNLAGILAGLLLSWWIYVPVHELLHAGGCWLGGGHVWRLEIEKIYGGGVLAFLFPFVCGSSEYGGRLAGFDTGGSDWVYALTVGLPFVLVLPGMVLMRRAILSRRKVLFGAALPLALSPLLSLTGDCLELASLLIYQVWPGPGGANRPLISDDLFRLIREQRGPAGLLNGASGWTFVLTSQLLGLLLALLTVGIGNRAAERITNGSQSGEFDG